MITPLPGATPLAGLVHAAAARVSPPRSSTRPARRAEWQGGILVVKKPWPSMIRTIWGDPERFKKSYFPEELKGKYYLAGDGAVRNKDTGYFTITGPHRRRAERVGPSDGHDGDRVRAGRQPAGRRSRGGGAARRPDRRGDCRVRRAQAGTRPEGDEAEKIAKDLRDWVGKEIGPIAKPKDIRFGDNLPKTRSGKIMRRLLRSIAKGERSRRMSRRSRIRRSSTS
jgi:acetyl-CoA synthetase